jgi:hypothetical protein
MAITTSIARHYAVRLIVMTIVMLVLGLWGVYDYFLAIPAQQRAFERYQAMSLTQRALQPDLAGEQLTQAVSEATEAIDREIDLQLNEHAGRTGIDRAELESPNWRQIVLVLADESNELPQQVSESDELPHAQQLVASLRETNQLEWTKALLLFQQALLSQRTPSGDLNDLQRSVYEMTEAQMNVLSKDEVPTPPSTFDRVTQWAFISCLLGVPYLLWVYVATIRRVYRLEEDGTLHTPEERWPAQQIADIDMSKWMAKSVAYVVHTDGRRIMLDDYKHRNMHLLVGALAHKFHPEEWTPEAKPVKKAVDENQERDGEEQIDVDEVYESKEEQV